MRWRATACRRKVPGRRFRIRPRACGIRLQVHRRTPRRGAPVHAVVPSGSRGCTRDKSHGPTGACEQGEPQPRARQRVAAPADNQLGICSDSMRSANDELMQVCNVQSSTAAGTFTALSKNRLRTVSSTGSLMNGDQQVPHPFAVCPHGRPSHGRPPAETAFRRPENRRRPPGLTRDAADTLRRTARTFRSC